jgi:hypothetical protein
MGVLGQSERGGVRHHEPDARDDGEQAGQDAGQADSPHEHDGKDVTRRS